jgi:hypothetical protein
MDMTFAFLKQFYGEDDPVLMGAMNGIEYAPHTDADWDPFSVVHKVRRGNPRGLCLLTVYLGSGR